MMTEALQMSFADSWIWLIFIGIGLALTIMELLVGVDTGFDLVAIGSSFVLGGLITWAFYSWILTLAVTLIICAAYVAVGRRYVHRWTATRKEKTNIDTIIGKRGMVIKTVDPNSFGLVKVGNEEWRARSETLIEKDEQIIVTEINGVTLTVKKVEGGK
jgi:membrane protein implicated in regulation of membrane protease activity